MNDIHMTRLVEWVIHRLGMALFWSLAAATICGVLAAITRQAGWLYVGAFASPLAGAFTLVASRAPLPDLEDVDAEN